MKNAYFLSIFFLKVTKTFAEYYKSVTKISCHVGKSFVSQLLLIRMALENSSKLREI